MLCSSPITISGLGVVGCGQCIPCRINKRREWVGRIQLEAGQYTDNGFWTLTYSDDHLPFAGSRGPLPKPSLDPAHARNWLKRFRKSIEPQRIRFYLVGEYGDLTERPHYHVAVFGFPTCLRGRTKRFINTNRPDWKGCCAVCRQVGESWGLGDVDLGQLTDESANYIAGYVLKKMTRADDLRLEGRFPEFSRQSNQNGGIGAGAMHDVASAVLQFNLVDQQGDVPSALRHGSRILPLGRYLRRRLRLLATGTEDAPQISQQYYKDEYARLQALQMGASAPKKFSLKQAKLKEDEGKLINSIARNKLHTRKKEL